MPKPKDKGKIIAIGHPDWGLPEEYEEKIKNLEGDPYNRARKIIEMYCEEYKMTEEDEPYLDELLKSLYFSELAKDMDKSVQESRKYFKKTYVLAMISIGLAIVSIIMAVTIVL
jgi:CHASE3 domain sensor protein